MKAIGGKLFIDLCFCCWLVLAV